MKTIKIVKDFFGNKEMKKLSFLTDTAWGVAWACLGVQPPVAGLTHVTLESSHPRQTITGLGFRVTSLTPGASTVAVTISYEKEIKEFIICVSL